MKPKYARKHQKKRTKLQSLIPGDKPVRKQPDVKRVQIPRRTQKSR